MSTTTSRSQQTGEILATGISLATRSLLINDEIDTSVVRQVWAALQVLDKPDTLLTVYLHTPGGYINSGFAIYDMLRAAEARIRIVGTGSIYSMGVVILQAGDERLLTEHASLLLHPASVEGIKETDLGVIALELADHQRNDRRTGGLLAERMGISLKQFQQRYKKNHYFSAPESVALGLADSIAY